MADRVLFIGWGNPVRGSEGRALESFNEALGMLGRRQQEGRIEGFEVALFEPNAELGGCVMIKGTPEQITTLRNEDEFRRNTMNAQLSVDGIRHIEGVTNEGVAPEMQMYEEAIAQVPQRA